MQESWLQDFEHSSEVAFFASTENGWSCDALGLHWLQRVFDQYTKQKAGRNYRLLILDGHNSHINLKFIDYADRNRILIAVLPPHSTHRLQPLDVGLFSALSAYYTQGCDQLMAIGHGLIHLTKRNFWLLFRDAWNQAFTAQNIESGWRATGLHPLNPDRVLSQIDDSNEITPPQTASGDGMMKTPGSLRAIRRIARQFRKEGLVDPRVTLLSRAAEKLASRHEIVQHENRDLLAALNMACKKQTRRKAMGLFNVEDNGGQPVFFSPTKVELVRQRQMDQEQADEQRQQAIEDRRLQRAIAREEKAREAAEKREERIALRQALQAQRAREKAERVAEREAKRAQKSEEADRQKAERIARKAERQAIREAKLQAAAVLKAGVRGHKRRDSGDKNDGCRKRLRTTGTQQRNKQNNRKKKPNSKTSEATVGDSTNPIAKSASPGQCKCREPWRPISQSLRSGRKTKPPRDYF